MAVLWTFYVLIVQGYTEIYEIKPNHWQYNEELDFLSVTQLYSYIFAINNHPSKASNALYTPAKAGTSLLSTLNGVILPFPGDSNSFIEIRTDTERPGMIYWKKLNCLKKNQVVAYTYSQADEKTFEAFLTYPELYAYEDPYITSVYDVSFISSFYNWCEQVEVSELKEGSYSYTKVVFPDGKTLYRCNGPYSFLTNKAPEANELTDLDLLHLYYEDTSFGEECWWNSTSEAHTQYQNQEIANQRPQDGNITPPSANILPSLLPILPATGFGLGFAF